MQCFYVAMGGVVVDFSAVEDQECKEFLSEKGLGSMWTLTTNGFHESRITDLPCKSISDKSKADVLAKGLVCFQVLWMVIQVRYHDWRLNLKINRSIDILVDDFPKDWGTTVDSAGDTYSCSCGLCTFYVRSLVWETSRCAWSYCNQSWRCYKSLGLHKGIIGSKFPCRLFRSLILESQWLI